MAFFDIRVFDPKAKRYKSSSLQYCYRTNERKWKRNKSIRNVWKWKFYPISFLINVGMGKEAKRYYSRITEKLAGKRDEPYSLMMSWIWRKVSFSMMRSIIMCICGSRSIRHEREKDKVEELASYIEARYNITWL